MQEIHRDDGFEATFVVSTPRAEAWKRLEKDDDGRWWIPGVESPADELEVVPETMLRTRKAAEPCLGTEIVITLEDADTGTRITFAQFGFGDGFSSRRPWLESGWWAIRADLWVFFEHGVRPERHARPWASPGCSVVEAPGGLLVNGVQPGALADQCGVQTGDLLLTIGGAPVVTIRELSILMRGRRPGTETKLRYLRGGELLTGTGTL